MKRMFSTLFFLSILNIAFAQFTITGKVLNMLDKKPLESATVFVNKSNYGTKTDKYGNFKIHNVLSGHYELIVSMVGYETYNVSILVKSDTKVPTIAIEEKATLLNDVKITNVKKIDGRYMNMFKREILGTTKFGEQCLILNPKVIHLNFDKNENKLTAYTSDFMIVENKALGYRLKYLVEDFEWNEKREIISYLGYVLFEPMQGNEEQQRDWNANRLEAYTGSLQHFLRSVLGKNINIEGETGFLVAMDTRSPNKRRLADSLIKEKIRSYTGKYSQSSKDSLFFWTSMFQLPKYVEVVDTLKLTAQDITQLTDQSGLYALRINTDTNFINKWSNILMPGKGSRNFKCDTCKFKNSLYITYVKNIPKTLGQDDKKFRSPRQESFSPSPEMNKVASLISTLDDRVFFDWNGVVINPMSLKLERYWAKMRLGDLLPINYLPDNKTDKYAK
nr:carboxypeptidase-like regulatory domain-containing protein [Pedobacter sp. ASV2]